MFHICENVDKKYMVYHLYTRFPFFWGHNSHRTWFIMFIIIPY